MRFRDDENTSFLQQKVPFINLVIVIFIAVILTRLFYLQVMTGEKNIKLATETFVREEEVVARRGNILDRNNVKLADTRPYFEIAVTPQYVEDSQKLIEHLSRMFPVTPEDIQKKLEKARYEPRFMPVAIVEDIPYDWAARLREHLLPRRGSDPYLLNGVSLRVTPLRRYLYPELFSHALGYLREVDKAKLEALRTEMPGVYSSGDLIGAAGVEKAYDLELRGTDGQTGRVGDARGREMAEVADVKVLQKMSTIAPEAGYHLRTTLDFDTQKVASEVFAGRKGAVVALDPNNGEIIAMFSSPGFDANRIMKNVDVAYWQKINLDEDKYLFNRAIQAMYPPASTYKPIAVIAGVASGVIDPLTTSFNCGGGLRFGNRFFKCWNPGGHGRVDVIRGMGQSCDVFFYQVGIKLGVDGLAEYAKMTGYGALTGVEIPYEKGGLVPTTEWKKRRFGQEWIESETLSVAIGQGYNLMTPLQNAKMAAMIANGGYEVTPHLGKDILNQDGSIHKTISHPLKPTPLVGTEAIEWARKGMIEVVHGYGTAGRLKASPYKIAGKTGTAQVIGHDSKARRTKNTENHGLFISYAPYDDPKIAVSVIVENGRSGSGAAAPVAMQVIDTYLGKIMPIPKEEKAAPQPATSKRKNPR